VLAAISATVKSGAFVGADETRAQEARFWTRFETGAETNIYAGVAVGGRWRFAGNNNPFYPFQCDGYFGAFGTFVPTAPNNYSLRAHLIASSGNTALNPRAKHAAAALDPATAAAWLKGKWYRFRWRLVPQGITSDTMTLHRLVDGGNEATEADWLLCCTLTVSAVLDPDFYQPTGAGSRYGFCSGFDNDSGYGSLPDYQPYIDLVDFRETSV
jgi:hypothetical protein